MKVQKLVDMFVRHGQVGRLVKVCVRSILGSKDSNIVLAFSDLYTSMSSPPPTFLTFISCLHMDELSYLFFRTTREISSCYPLFTTERIEA